jgi:heme exporter protein B
LKAYVRAVFAILWKDLLLELRTREAVLPILVFALLVAVIFNFAFEPRRDLVLRVAPGILWVSITFAGMLGFQRSFAAEKEQGGQEGMLLAPVSRDALYLGKLLGSFIFILAVELVLLPVFLMLFNLPLGLPGLWLVVLLGTLGFSAVGTAFAAMASNARAREVLLPLLFFPIVVPVIIAAVQATAGVMRDAPFSDYSRWLGLMAAFDVLFLVLAAMTFDFVLGE